MTEDAPTPTPEGGESVFGRGLMVFLTAIGVAFAAIAVAIPLAIITFNSDGDASVAPPVSGGGVPGEQIALDNGCLACHSTDGSDLVGPTWLGVAGAERPLESGETVLADDVYLETSIVDPPYQVVAGFQPLMPTTYRDQLSDQEVSDLVDYIKSLG